MASAYEAARTCKVSHEKLTEDGITDKILNSSIKKHKVGSLANAAIKVIGKNLADPEKVGIAIPAELEEHWPAILDAYVISSMGIFEKAFTQSHLLSRVDFDFLDKYPADSSKLGAVTDMLKFILVQTSEYTVTSETSVDRSICFAYNELHATKRYVGGHASLSWITGAVDDVYKLPMFETYLSKVTVGVLKSKGITATVGIVNDTSTVAYISLNYGTDDIALMVQNTVDEHHMEW